MLRRYSSRGVETLPIESRRTIGRHGCDINLKGADVASPHVAVELHPFTRTYWLRELSLTGTTVVNGRQIHGQIELHSGDLIRLGDAQPLVFEDGAVFPVRKISSGMNSHAMNRTFDPEAHTGILPVLGHRIEPHQTTYRTLNGSRNSSEIRLRPKKSSHLGFREKRLNATTVTPNSLVSSSTSVSIDSNSEVSSRQTINNGIKNVVSVGNSLLQRVVRLQSEVSRKDEEILSLLHKLRSFEGRLPKMNKTYQDTKHSSLSGSLSLNFELEAYRSFIHVMSQKLHQFNDLTLLHPQKNYADIFLKISRNLDEPFAVKMNEIEEDCRKEMNEKGFDELQLLQLQPFLIDEQKEQIVNLGQEIEALFPIIKDACNFARESIHVCTVFTQWSRHLGDSLRTYGLKSSVLNHAIDCLKEQFAGSEMSKHWLPPSIAPLFRLIALETEKRESKKEKDTQTESSQSVPQSPYLEDEHIFVAKSLPVETAPNTDILLSMINKAEEKTVQLQEDIDSLSDSIKQRMELDKETEQHLDDLCTALFSIETTLQHFTEQNDKRTHKRSILSVNISEHDVKEGIQQLQKGECSQEKQATEKEDDHLANIEWKAFEILRNSLLEKLHINPSTPSDKVVSIRKDWLMDLIYFATQLSNRLEELEDNEEKKESSRTSVEEGYQERMERIEEEFGDHLDEKIEDTEDFDRQKKEVREDTQEPSDEADKKEKKNSIAMEAIVPSEEYESQHISSSRLNLEESNEGSYAEVEKKDEVETQKDEQEQEEEHKPTSLDDIPIITEHEAASVDNLPPTTTLFRPKSARPRSSYELQKLNGNVIMKSEPMKKKIPSALSLESTYLDNVIPPTSFTEPESAREKKDWSSEGSVEEVSLTGTTVDVPSPAADMEHPIIPEEDSKLMEARRKATEGLADCILNASKPKNICEVPYNAHVQSHINTATRFPHTNSKIPVNSFDLFNSPPSEKKKVKIEEKPPLRQPRMQFKL